MNTKISRILNYTGFVFILLAIFGLGFWFGTKYIQTQENESKIIVETTTTSSSINNIKDIKTTENPEIFWIKVGQQPVCPETHPIKGKFSTDSGIYYLTENKNYDRVKPHICFKTEEFTRDVAGFVKKY